MHLWPVIIASLATLVAGAALGPLLAYGPRLRRQLTLGGAVLGLVLQIIGHNGLIWFVMLWASFSVGDGLRRRLRRR